MTNISYILYYKSGNRKKSLFFGYSHVPACILADEKEFMGYKVRLQKIERPTNKTFCVTVPVVMVEAMELKKGDELEWFIEDKNTMILRRKKLRKTGNLKCDFR